MEINTKFFSDYNTLFLIDDCANLHDYKMKESAICKLAFHGRHHNISTWIITQKYNAIFTQSKFIAITALHCFKFHSFYFRNQNTPYYLLNRSIIIRPNLSRKCFVMFLLLFLSGDIQLNPGPVSLKSLYVSSPLDVYKPFLSPTVPKLCMATLNSRSVVNKSAVINNHILENKIHFMYHRNMD